MAHYSPPRVWTWISESGGKFANINRPVAGATHDCKLPLGEHPLQLYSLGTPNGVKVTILLEELLALGIDGAEYDAHLIDIFNGDQFGSDFVEINPNSKIPALLDRGESVPVRVFESGAILLYLAQKFDKFIPRNVSRRSECMSWLCWQMSNTPYFGGGFGHFFYYAPEEINYAINLYAKVIKHQFEQLDEHLSMNHYLCGNEYTIADMAIWPWYGAMLFEDFYNATDFLNIKSYKSLDRWAHEINDRVAVSRGRRVNRTWGKLEDQMKERHDASDF